MVDLPWNLGIIKWLAAHRIEWLTNIFLVFTFLGDEMGYILIVISIYWLYSKRLSVRLVMAVITTTLINHSLKLLIRNPRPFVKEGTYKDNWAISQSNMEDTAHSFSTPSGHAQGSSTFWWYLHLKVKSRLTFVLLPIMILMIGISRPYLGVHYVEDVILGWIVGFIIVIFLYRYDELVATWWNRQSKMIRYVIAIAIPMIVLLAVGFISGFSSDGTQYITLAGIFTGVVLGYQLEGDQIDFDPSLSAYSTLLQKLGIAIGRLLIGIIIVGLMLVGLDQLFTAIAADDTLVGYVLRWLRYGLVGFGGTYIAPLVFRAIKLTPQSEA